MLLSEKAPLDIFAQTFYFFSAPFSYFSYFFLIFQNLPIPFSHPVWCADGQNIYRCGMIERIAKRKMAENLSHEGNRFYILKYI